MSSLPQSGRADVVAQLRRLGPDAPTLCEGWQTQDLAAHLVLRERRPDAALGIVFPPAAGWTRRVQRQVRDRHSYPELLDLLAGGPPLLSPVGRLVDAPVNTIEYFVHGEDIRRAQPDWTPRDPDPGLDDLLWSRLRMMARLLLRRAPVAVRLRRAGTLDSVAGGSGHPEITVTGPPGELLLFAYGRQQVARVECEGPQAVVDRVGKASLGM